MIRRRIPRNYYLQQLLDIINKVIAEEHDEQEVDTTNLSKREIVDNYLDEFEPMLYRGKHCLVYYSMIDGQCTGSSVYFLEGEEQGLLFSTSEDFSKNPYLANPEISNFALCGCKVVYLSTTTFGEFKNKNKMNSTSRYTDDTEGIEIFDTTCKSRYFVKKDDPELRKLRCLGESFTPELLEFLSRSDESNSKPEIDTFGIEEAKQQLANGKNVSRVAWNGDSYLTEHNIEALGSFATILITKVKGILGDDCKVSVWNPTEEDLKAIDYHVVRLKSEQ